MVDDGGEEAEPLEERARRLAEHHERLSTPRGNLGGAACPGESHLRLVVVADHRAVQVPVTIDLRGTEEANIDPAALEPVREDLRHRDDGVGRLGELAVANREGQVPWLRPDAAALLEEGAALGGARAAGSGR